MIEIYTDASFKDGYSSHHFYAKQNSKRLNRRTFLGMDDTSMKAEATSIINALRKVKRKGWDAIIYTDCLSIVEGVNSEEFVSEDVRFIKHMLKVTGAKLEWKSRETKGIQKADSECKKMMKTKMRRVN